MKNAKVRRRLSTVCSKGNGVSSADGALGVFAWRGSRKVSVKMMAYRGWRGAERRGRAGEGMILCWPGWSESGMMAE